MRRDATGDWLILQQKLPRHSTSAEGPAIPSARGSLGRAPGIQALDPGRFRCMHDIESCPSPGRPAEVPLLAESQCPVGARSSGVRIPTSQSHRTFDASIAPGGGIDVMAASRHSRPGQRSVLQTVRVTAASPQPANQRRDSVAATA